MELRQLEYFIAAVEEGSFFKAAEKLFTTQPNISKSVNKLEQEAGVALLFRTNKGIRVTAQGEKFYHYAKNAIQQIEIMSNISNDVYKNMLTVSSYPSKFVAKALVRFYEDYPKKYAVDSKHELNLEYYEGTVQENIDWVSSGVCELGIVYVGEKQLSAFEHIISHKDLEFVELCQSELCVYVGKHHPLADRDIITVEELNQLEFVRGVREFFSVEHHFDHVNINALNSREFKDRMLTNSNHLVASCFKELNMAYLGIMLMEDAERGHYKMIRIEDAEKFLTLGYIKHKVARLSDNALNFIEEFKSHI